MNRQIKSFDFQSSKIVSERSCTLGFKTIRTLSFRRNSVQFRYKFSSRELALEKLPGDQFSYWIIGCALNHIKTKCSNRFGPQCALRLPNTRHIDRLFQLLLVASLAIEICFTCENSQEDPIDTYVVFASSILVMVKLFLLRMRRSTLSTNLSCAVQDWRDVKDPRSREIMIQHARIARTISLLLFYCGFFAFMLYMLRLLPFLNATDGRRTYYLPTSCLLESASNVEYVVITFYQVVQLFITYAGNCCTEGIFVGITLHLCGQLELLMINFRRIDRREHKYKGDSIVEELVVRHRHLLKLTETIEDSYNVIILTQIFTSAILICITGEFVNLFRIC